MFPRLGFGLGLRVPHYHDAVTTIPRVDWWEVISENVMVAGGNPRRVLRAVADRWPIALHGVSLSIGSVDPLDADHLARLRTLVSEVEPAIVSDHLCWSSFGGHAAHDLWPLPYTEEALAHVVARVAHVQDVLGRRILLENPSSYAAFTANELAEPTFLAEVARRADCGILLDVNNVYVSGTNHGWDPRAYIAALPAERVGQIHLAGHSDRGTRLRRARRSASSRPSSAIRCGWSRSCCAGSTPRSPRKTDVHAANCADRRSRGVAHVL